MTFDAVFLLDAKKDEINIGEYSSKNNEKGGIFAKKLTFGCFYNVSWKDTKTRVSFPRTYFIATAKSMLAAQEKIMSLFACIYVRACVCTHV